MKKKMCWFADIFACSGFQIAKHRLENVGIQITFNTKIACF